MTDFVANFELEQNNFDANFELENVQFDAVFEINPAGASWGTITGRIEDQTDLINILNEKVDLSEFETLEETVTDNSENITNNSNNIIAIQNTLNSYGDIVTYDAADFATKNQGLLAESALQPNDNISELNNNAGYITNSALNGYATETWVNNKGYITGIDSSDVVEALGYTPYNASNPAGYITASSLPTVNNSKITIQKNGTNVDNFTLNQGFNKTINITVPTTASDVGALPNSTNYGAKIYLSLNTTNYKLTVTLLDQYNNVLSEQFVDFPLESVVVDGSYDNANKKIVLTLQNGTTIDIPVGDLVAGLQTEITSTNKLDADLVDDTNSSHKFATAAQLSQIATNTSSISNLATVATSGSYNDLTNKPTIPTDTNDLTNGAGFITSSALSPYALSSSLATVATSGSYNDLSNKPTIPAAQVQADWNVTDTTSKAYIKNKPTIPSGVVVDQTFDGTSANAQSGVAIQGELSTNYQSKLVSGTSIRTVNSTSLLGSGNLSLASATLSNVSSISSSSAVYTALRNKQDTLVSGTNIKTINNTSLLGSSNIAVQPTLVSGTNIKTINNTSLLGSGNIDTTQIFVATYGTTTFSQIQTAVNNGNTVILDYNGKYLPLVYLDTDVLQKGIFSAVYNCTEYNATITFPSSWSNNSFAIAKTSDIPDISTKQDTLVSGTNIKTVNNTSLLGSGNLSLANTTLSNVLSIDNSSAVATTLNGKADTTLSNVSSIDSNSAVQTALDGKADTDLSNLSATGKTVIDGQWVLGLNYTLSSATAIGTYTCNLTSYLPSGNDKYEVLLDCQIVATNSTYVGIKDGTYDNYAFCATGGSRPARNIIAIALTGKTFKYDIAGAALSSGYLRLRGYRRIGTNT